MKKIMFMGIVAAMAISVQAFAQNLIVNGDFEAGNTGFVTEYTYLDPSITGAWTLGPEYMYTVSTDPSLYHSAWSSFAAHGGSNMMIVNGTWEDTSPGYNAVVWAQSVDLPSCVATYPLYAGKTWEIGEVQARNEDGHICVRFVLTDADAIAEGWLITEVHVAIGEGLSDIPQKNGNPIPGRFPVSLKLDPGVTETDWYCLPYEGETIIAAHAKLELPEIGHWDTEPEPDVWVVDRPYDSETGWGGACGGFPGKNWATYICYEPVDCSTSYTFTFWAGNSYPGSAAYPAQPAILEVQINGEVVGLPLTLEYNPPYAPAPGWTQYSGTWDVGSATSALIEIRDTRHIMYGDDFVIDDISFEAVP